MCEGAICVASESHCLALGLLFGVLWMASFLLCVFYVNVGVLFCSWNLGLPYPNDVIGGVDQFRSCF